MKNLRPQFIAYSITLLMAAACSSGGNGGGGGGSGGEGGAGGQGGSGSGGAAATCFTPVSTLTVNRACATDADCAMADRAIDCCGSLATFGINKNDLAAFTAAEMMCQPICDCLSKPTVADDGKTVTDPTAVTLSCMGGTCMTAVP